MKYKLHSVLILSIAIVSCFTSCSQTIPGDSLYLGQVPPGDTPVVFAPGIISTLEMQHSAPTFTPDAKEIYWSETRISNDSCFQLIMYMKYTGEKWEGPEMAPFSNGKYYEGGPVISSDGSKLYIYRGKPAPPGGNADSINIICFTRNGNKWVNPVTIGEGVFHSVADNGTIYYGGASGIYRMILKTGEYSAPELLNDKINKPGYQNWTPFIAADESYLIFSRLNKSGDYGELMIAFHNTETNEWSEPINMGKQVNTRSQERFPSISPDRRYLFFNRWVPNSKDDIFWVSSSVIDTLKKEFYNGVKK